MFTECYRPCDRGQDKCLGSIIFTCSTGIYFIRRFLIPLGTSQSK